MARIHGHDVSHGEEGSESGDNFAADGCLVVREFEELIEPAIHDSKLRNKSEIEKVRS